MDDSSYHATQSFHVAGFGYVYPLAEVDEATHRSWAKTINDFLVESGTQEYDLLVRAIMEWELPEEIPEEWQDQNPVEYRFEVQCSDDMRWWGWTMRSIVEYIKSRRERDDYPVPSEDDMSAPWGHALLGTG